MKKLSSIIGILLVTLICIHAQNKKLPKLTGPYLGQKPPGIAPEIFAPGIISSEGVELCISFSADGRECYFQRGRKILVTQERNGSWAPPEVASFSGIYPDGDPFLTIDGKKLFFTSERPIQKEDDPKKDTDIWYVKREGQEWSEPVYLGNKVNTTNNERTPTIALDGTLYFHVFDGKNPCDLFYSNFENEKYSSPKPVIVLNTASGSEADAYISSQKEFILFLQDGISISFADENGDWKIPIRLKDIIGSQYENTWPRVSPDEKYLFFSSFRPDPDHPNTRPPSIYWLSFEAILTEINQ